MIKFINIKKTTKQLKEERELIFIGKERIRGRDIKYQKGWLVGWCGRILFPKGIMKYRS